MAYCNWLTDKVVRKPSSERASRGDKCYIHLPTEKQWALAEGEEFAGLALLIRAQLARMFRQNQLEPLASVPYELVQLARDYDNTQARETSLVDLIASSGKSVGLWRASASLLREEPPELAACGLERSLLLL